MSVLEQFDGWLMDDTVAALTARQPLRPVEQPGAVIFPPTFAASDTDEDEGAKGDYQIDWFMGRFSAKVTYQKPGQEVLQTDLQHDAGGNVCLVNSVGAEANRVEIVFRPDKCGGKYASLVPQIVVRAGAQLVNLLDAGHRAGDALIRFTTYGEKLFDAFQAFLEVGDAEKLAQLAPTSIVFGVWDSRGTQAKLPRVFRSVVRAYDVVPIRRSAQFNRAVKYVENGLIPEKLDSGSGKSNPLSQEGFKDSPAGNTPGGVIVTGELRREMTINLSAIRRLRVPAAGSPQSNDDPRTLALRRYILGLTLVAATARNEERFDLREGCHLKAAHPAEWMEVPYEGEDVPVGADRLKTAPEYAKLAAESFGVGTSDTFEFDKAAAEKWLKLDKKARKKRQREKPMTQQFPPDEAPTPVEVADRGEDAAPVAAPKPSGRGGRKKSEGEAK